MAIVLDGTANTVTPLNGALGATTPSTVAATTVVASSTIKGASTIAVGNATPSASGAGITFPATQSASTDANTLDDYEEGTWTPVFKDNANNTATMSVQQGFYTKTGNIINVWCQVQYSSRTALTGSYVQVTGVPFIPRANTGSYYYTGAVWMTSTALYPIVCIGGNEPNFAFFNSSSSAIISPSALNSTNGGFMFSIAYFTS